jgi:hypothetical protein
MKKVLLSWMLTWIIVLSLPTDAKIDVNDYLYVELWPDWVFEVWLCVLFGI